jgi:hypothetical protein
MHQIHLGNSSEFVQIRVPDPSAIDDGIDCDVQVRVRGFSASVTAYCEPSDFEMLETALRSLYENLSGQASFTPRDGQLTFTLTGNGRGGIEVEGAAWFVACYGSKLEFAFDIDQTYLPPVLDQLRALNGG